MLIKTRIHSLAHEIVFAHVWSCLCGLMSFSVT